MPILDELSGFEFEDVMEDVFRNLGYENVRQAAKTADEGRDIVMEEVVDGTRRSIVVECKHTGSVGRPVVQKLHSAIATHDFDGPKRGMVVTTGRFSGPAEEYAERLDANDDPYPIELVDGRDLRELAEEVGLDLYNGRIEVLCDETLRPRDPTGTVDSPLFEVVRDVENLSVADLPPADRRAHFQPVVVVSARVQATFETSVGVVHRVDEADAIALHAGRGGPTPCSSAVAQLVASNLSQAVDLDEDAFAETFDDLVVDRFGQTQTEYKDWAVDRFRRRHTTTVRYTGDNNVTYTKECEPRQSDISVQSVTPIYLPQVRFGVTLGEYTHGYEAYVAGPSRVTVEDAVRRCVHCETDASDETYTYCANCGSINCERHTKTERLEGTPVCTGCSVTEQFAFATKHFYDEANLETFREEYEAMAVHEKAMENPPLVGGGAVTAVVLALTLLVVTGVI
ncbi:restriction endonuclease [Haloglomus salinum]|uniref:restriction endonuclease n=1 Tax=Haloglomus salinum TaxID=2962673 RepID=UPI0020C9984D|nr:restriction endonuclease [Haloglomus salinum]